LNEKDNDFKYVSELFFSSWKHSDKPIPKIISIWKIYCSKDLISQYDLYRKKVGNEHQLFHGTKAEICIKNTCAICCILKEGYKLNHANCGLFGKGIYFSSTSSKCDNFSSNLLENYEGVNYKVMLLNNVALGKIYRPTENDFTLTNPPHKYDSVIGDPKIVKNLKDLKHDEIIVYKEEASIPKFLIVYQP
ncbi:768_t:CDS:2, partial [Scutellospora calospora]